MKIILIILTSLIIVIDFIKLNKNNKEVVYTYIGIILLVAIISIIDNIGLLKRSPLEVWISKMEPITQWVEMKLK